MTNPGQNQELPKTFFSEQLEKNWYSEWEQKGHFRPKPGKAKQTFCIIMPPPNVTGILHMGHALDATTQDVLTRYKRMKGLRDPLASGNGSRRHCHPVK